MPLPPPRPPLFVLSRPVVLVGMMGAGKSSTGRKLADLLAAPFKDCDWEIEHRTGMTIRHYFAAHGEADFRQLECKTIAELIAHAPPPVIAAGGGTFIQPAAQEVILARSISVWLKASLETLAGRVLGPQLASRPLLAGSNEPKSVLAKLLEERSPVYAKAHVTVEVDNLRPDAVAQAVAKAVQQQGGAAS